MSDGQDIGVRNRLFNRRRVLLLLVAGAGLIGTGIWSDPDQFIGALEEWKEDTRADPHDVFYHGWYPSWAQYNDRYLPQDVSLNKHDSLSAFSVHPNENGEVVYSNEQNDPTMLSSFQRLKEDDRSEQRTPIHLTIGGWNNSKYFSNAALTEESRERFASSAVSMMRQYNLDGIDIDWEFPTGHSPPDTIERDEDPENVVLLLEALRNRLDSVAHEDGRNYTLTYAAPYQREHIRALQTEKMSEFIDYWIVMAIEMAGETIPETRHDFPNYASKATSPADSMDRAMSDWLEIGNIRRDNLVIETGFYGKMFNGVPPGPRGDGLGQPFETYMGPIGRNKVAELEEDPNWESYWDDDAEAAYMYNETSEQWVTYANTQTIKTKVDYLFREGFLGITGWETSLDPADELLDSVRTSFSALRSD